MRNHGGLTSPQYRFKKGVVQECEKDPCNGGMGIRGHRPDSDQEMIEGLRRGGPLFRDVAPETIVDTEVIIPAGAESMLPDSERVALVEPFDDQDLFCYPPAGRRIRCREGLIMANGEFSGQKW